MGDEQRRRIREGVEAGRARIEEAVERGLTAEAAEVEGIGVPTVGEPEARVKIPTAHGMSYADGEHMGVAVPEEDLRAAGWVPALGGDQLPSIEDLHGFDETAPEDCPCCNNWRRAVALAEDHEMFGRSPLADPARVFLLASTSSGFPGPWDVVGVFVSEAAAKAAVPGSPAPRWYQFEEDDAWYLDCRQQIGGKLWEVKPVEVEER